MTATIRPCDLHLWNDSIFFHTVRLALLYNDIAYLRAMDVEQLGRAYRLRVMSFVIPMDPLPGHSQQSAKSPADTIEFILANDREKSVSLDTLDELPEVTPLELAIQRNFEAAAFLLLQYGARPTLRCFQLLADRVNIEMQFALLKTGYQLEQPTLDLLAAGAFLQWFHGHDNFGILFLFYVSIGAQVVFAIEPSGLLIEIGGQQVQVLHMHADLEAVLYCLAMGTAKRGSIPTDYMVSSAARNSLKHAVHRWLFDFVYPDALIICIALQSLDLPAPVIIEIIDHACVGAHHLPYYLKWALVTRAKHFHDKPK